MKFIKDMEIDEKTNDYRRYKIINFNCNVGLSIQASSIVYSEPRKTLPLNEYKKMMIAFIKNDKQTTARNVLKNNELINELEGYKINGNIYGYVPIDLIEKIYMELKETTVKSHRIEEYEVCDKGGRVVCESHGLIRCGVCHYIHLIEKENAKLKAENKLLKEMQALNNKQEALQ